MSSIKFSTINFLAVLGFTLGLFSCQDSKKIKVDHTKWQQDLINCGNYRKTVYKSIIKDNQEYIGLNEEEVTAQLGLPEKEALEKRMKKSIRYQVSGYACDSLATVKKYLVFELESLRRVRSIYVTLD